MLAIYVIAMIATTWHFAYGIWLFAAKWGITPGDKARKRFGYVCAVVGVGLCLMGLASIYAVVSAPPAPEDVMPAQSASIALPAPTSSTTELDESSAAGRGSMMTSGLRAFSHWQIRIDAIARLAIDLAAEDWQTCNGQRRASQKDQVEFKSRLGHPSREQVIRTYRSMLTRRALLVESCSDWHYLLLAYTAVLDRLIYR